MDRRTRIREAVTEGNVGALAGLMPQRWELDTTFPGDAARTLNWLAGYRKFPYLERQVRSGYFELKEATDTLLCVAVRLGHTDMTRYLLAAGVNVERGSDPPMCLAAAAGRMDLACALFERGASARAKDTTSMTALHWASHYGHADIARLLLEKGADIDACTEDKIAVPPLFVAGLEENVDVMNVLLEHGANIQLKIMEVGSTMMMMLASEGKARAVEALLAVGVNANTPNDFGYTSLHSAAMKGHLNVVRVLLAHEGIHVDARSKHNHTPLYNAVSNGHADVVEALVAANADVHAEGVLSASSPGLDFDLHEPRERIRACLRAAVARTAES